MTPAEAAVLHASASADDGHVMWFVTLSDPAHPGQAVAVAKNEMDAAAYRNQIARLGLTQERAAHLLGVNARTSRRWALDERAIPSAVERLLWTCEQHPELIEAFNDKTRWPDEAAEPG